jgi:hypothetical protein
MFLFPAFTAAFGKCNSSKANLILPMVGMIPSTDKFRHVGRSFDISVTHWQLVILTARRNAEELTKITLVLRCQSGTWGSTRAKRVLSWPPNSRTTQHDVLVNETRFNFCTNYVEDVCKSFRTESITKYTLTEINTRWEATKRLMAAKLTRMTYKIAIQLHLVAESSTICSYRSGRPVRKLLDTLSYPKVYNIVSTQSQSSLLYSSSSYSRGCRSICLIFWRCRIGISAESVTDQACWQNFPHSR